LDDDLVVIEKPKDVFIEKYLSDVFKFDNFNGKVRMHDWYEVFAVYSNTKVDVNNYVANRNFSYDFNFIPSIKRDIVLSDNSLSYEF
jgi:hypothetical protein